MSIRKAGLIGALLVAWIGVGVPSMAAELPPVGESKRLATAKGYIFDEQWRRAIEVLNVMLRDVKEAGKDEALYWLAHSLNQSSDTAGALATIRRLETEYPSSIWVRPARAVRLEIAVRLGRSDVLWVTAAAAPAKPDAPAKPATPHAVPRTPPRGRGSVTVHTVEGATTTFWLPETYHPETDLRIQALQHLITIDAARAIPMLKEICFETNDPGPASRAVFALAQAQRPEAYATVVDIAKAGPAPAKLAALRALGRIGGKDAADILIHVYPTGDSAVKLQVVQSLGERSARAPLFKIAQVEVNRDLRIPAILTLGQAGGAPELLMLYRREGAEYKRPILRGLFNARAETELIYIAGIERDPSLRDEVLSQLRLLGTPKTKEYLQKVSQKK